MRLLFTLLWFLPALCLAQPPAERPALVFGCTDFPPYCAADAQGKPQGLLVSLFQLLGEQAGLDISFRVLPYARLAQEVRDGRIQLGAAAEDNPLVRLSLASRHVLFDSQLCLYPRPGLTPGALPDTLKGRRLLLIHGSLYPGKPAQALLTDAGLALRKTYAQTHAAALGMLERGRADYLLDYHEVVTRLPLAEGQVLPACLLVERLRLRYFVLADVAQGVQLRDALDAALSRLAADGRLPDWVVRPSAPGEVAPAR